LSLYLEFRYCCVNQFGYILFIVYIRFVVFFYRLVNKVDHTLFVIAVRSTCTNDL